MIGTMIPLKGSMPFPYRGYSESPLIEIMHISFLALDKFVLIDGSMVETENERVKAAIRKRVES